MASANIPAIIFIFIIVIRFNASTPTTLPFIHIDLYVFIWALRTGETASSFQSASKKWNDQIHIQHLCDLFVIIAQSTLSFASQGHYCTDFYNLASMKTQETFRPECNAVRNVANNNYHLLMTRKLVRNNKHIFTLTHTQLVNVLRHNNRPVYGWWERK